MVVNFVSWLDFHCFLCPTISGGKIREEDEINKQARKPPVILQHTLDIMVGESRAIAYQSLLLFSLMLKSWELPGDEVILTNRN